MPAGMYSEGFFNQPAHVRAVSNNGIFIRSQQNGLAA